MDSLAEKNDALLEALLDSWQRNNLTLLNLLGALPPEGLAARATASSHTVSEMFMHMHHERLISVSEEVPELAPKVPDQEWVFETDSQRIAQLLQQSAEVVGQAVKSTVESGQDLKMNYAHPVQLIQFLIFHEGYHHGQIKLALKIAGHPITDEIAGPLIWDVWRAKQLSASIMPG